MKNILYIAIALLFVACDGFDLDDNDIGNLQSLPEYVAFDAPGDNANRPDDAVDEGEDISLIVEAPAGTLEDIAVDYSFGGDAVFGTDFTVDGASASGGSVTIVHNLDATGGTSTGGVSVTDRGFIDVEFLTDDVADGDKVLTVTLTAANRGGEALAVGRGGMEMLRTATINISDID